MQYLEGRLSLEKFTAVNQILPSDFCIRKHGERQVDIKSYVAILVLVPFKNCF